MRTRLRPRSWPWLRRGPLLWLAAALCLPGCGDAPLAGLDRTRPDQVFAHALRAANRADLAALRDLLTASANETLRNELHRWQRILRDPEWGPHYLGLARERLGAEAEAAFGRARDGGYADALALFMRLAPRPDRPPVRRTQIGAEAWEFLYEDDRGVLKPVRVVRDARDGLWYVEVLGL